MKPKSNYATKDGEYNLRDDCQTPPYALGPLLPYLHRSWTVWEPCAGKGRLADELEKHVSKVIRTSLETGQDFFEYEPDEPYDAIVSNFPFSKKFSMMKRCYEIGKPWAALVPVETIGAGSKAHPLFEKYWIEAILLDKRIDYEMPNQGFSGGGAQFPSCWLCWKMTGRPNEMLFRKLDKPSKRKPKEPRVLLPIAEKNALPGVATHQVDIYEMIEMMGGKV